MGYRTRIHAIILTHNRPAVLDRCVYTAHPFLEAQDTLTVLDDSDPRIMCENRGVVSQSASTPTSFHVSAKTLERSLLRSLPERSLCWLQRTAARDIAPLRNCALLLSLCIPTQTTVLIDDDVTSFDLAYTHRMLQRLAVAHPTESVIVGGHIAGVDEHDVLTRLDRAIQSYTLPRVSARRSMLVETHFRRPAQTTTATPIEVEWVSGGYLAFCLAPERVIAFPPGYNEDWLWCVSSRREGHARVFRLPQVVYHEPVGVKRPTADDVLFELFGDLILDQTLDASVDREPSGARANGPPQVVAQPRPSVDSPATRVQNLLERIEAMDRDRELVSAFGDFGLTTVKEMLERQDLTADWGRGVSAWRINADEKRTSFAATIGSKAARATVQAVIEDGRL